MTCVARFSAARARTRARAGGAAGVLAAVTVAAVFVVPPGRAGAQAAARMGPYERALRLVEAGRGAEGRALTDSLVLAAGPGSPALAEALWWRATLAGGADSAERDLRRLIAEVPASPRTGPAAVRLAQLALLRDRPDDATRLLEPLVRTRAGDPVRPIAGYWLARARLERRDAAGACAALDGASGAPVFDVDLARQLAGLRRRVPGCGGTAVAAVPAPSAAPSTALAAPPAVVGSLAAESGAMVSSGIASGAVAGVVAPAPATAAPGALPPTTTPAPATMSAAPSGVGGSAGAVAPPAAARSGGAASTASGAAASAAPAARSVAGGSAAAFAVQVSAYDTRGGADVLAARLRAGGLDAFTEGQGAAGDLPPFRVKVGRYATRAAATSALAGLRRRGLAGFVTSARPAAPAGAR